MQKINAPARPVPELRVGESHVVRTKHPWRWVTVAIIVIFVVSALHTIITNPRFRWDVVGSYLFAPQILDGIRITLILTVLAMTAGTVLGLIVALLRLADNPVLRAAGFAYVWFFRGVPLLVQLVFWYNLSALFPVIELGIPFGPVFAELDANSIITAMTASVLALSLHQAAYMAEIIRSGIQSVDERQREAAKTLGLGPLVTLRRVVLPQAMRVIIPPTGNETISMLKLTSLVSVVAVTDLLYSVQLIYSRNFQTIPLLIVATLWYLLLVSLLSVGQAYLERHYSRGQSMGATPSRSSLAKRLLSGGRGSTPVDLGKEHA
jgi:polar amino acid transport system permease protein